MIAIRYSPLGNVPQKSISTRYHGLSGSGVGRVDLVMVRRLLRDSPATVKLDHSTYQDRETIARHAVAFCILRFLDGPHALCQRPVGIDACAEDHCCIRVRVCPL